MADPTMTPEKRAFLEELLKTAVSKMAYGDDVEWEMTIDGEEDDEQLLFEELRKVSSVKSLFFLERFRKLMFVVLPKSLRTIGDGIAWIDPELYASAVRTIVGETLDAFEASPSSVPWQRVELALALLYGFGEFVSIILLRASI